VRGEITDSLLPASKVHSSKQTELHTETTDMKLLVRNLDRNTTETELRALFEAFGKVQSCTVVTEKYTGKSKGFGFVDMPSPGESKAAMKNINNMEVGGKKIRVKRTTPGQDTAKDAPPAHCPTGSGD